MTVSHTIPSTTAPVVTAAASIAVAPLIEGSRRSGVVLGVSGRAAWVGVDDEVLLLADPAAVRLPNGISLGRGAEAVRVGAPVAVGDGEVSISGVRIRPLRWWDPRPVLPVVTESVIADRLAAAGAPVFGDGGLHVALQSGDPEQVLAVADRLLGRGDGLTPWGDDLLAGALAAHALLGEAVGRDSEIVGAVAGPIGVRAATRTTALSAALLRHGCRGEVADPAARFLEALCGREAIAPAAGRLEAVGHSSGPAILAGISAGARAVIG